MLIHAPPPPLSTVLCTVLVTFWQPDHLVSSNSIQQTIRTPILIPVFIITDEVLKHSQVDQYG